MEEESGNDKTQGSTLVYTSSSEDETTRDPELGKDDEDNDAAEEKKDTEPQPEREPEKASVNASKVSRPESKKSESGNASKVSRPAGELAEDGAGATERDEELLSSIDEQLARLRNEKPRVTETNNDEAKHRLIEEDSEAKHRLNTDETDGDVER